MASNTSRWWRARAARPEAEEAAVAVAEVAEGLLRQPEHHKSLQLPRPNRAMLPFLQCPQHHQRLQHLQRLERLRRPQPTTIRNCSSMLFRTEYQRKHM